VAGRAPYDGEILVIQQPRRRHRHHRRQAAVGLGRNGTSAADITGATFGTNTANSTSKLVIDPKAVPGGFLGYVGTIATGPSLVSVVASGKKKIV
jgi:hypothetical protein